NSTTWIRERLFNLVSEEEVLRALDHLVALGVLSQDNDGRLRQTYKQLKTTPVLKRLSAKLFYEGLLKRAIEALHVGEPEEREFGALLVGLSPYQMDELKKRVREFIAELNDY